MPEAPSNFDEFNAQAAGKALRAKPRTTRDVAHGDGEALDVGETTLEVYRDAGVTRVTTPDARIELFRVPSYMVTGERVVFEQGEDSARSRLLVRGDGKVSFYPVLRAVETPQTQETVVSGRQDSPAGHVPSETPTAVDGNTATPDTIRSGEIEQVRLQGRLGRDPWFRTDGQDQPIGGFPLAVNREDGVTSWHKVAVFDEPARQLYEDYSEGDIRKGRMVSVNGQHVVREEEKPDGGVKKHSEFHASAVQRVHGTRVRPGR